MVFNLRPRLRSHSFIQKENSQPNVVEEQVVTPKHTKNWRQRMKLNPDPDVYATFLKEDAHRKRTYRASLSTEQRQHQNETAKVRMRRYRQRLKDKKKSTQGNEQEQSKPTTRADEENKDKQRQRWREAKQKQRRNTSVQKRRRINEKRREEYHRKKTTSASPPGQFAEMCDSLTSSCKGVAVRRAKKALPCDPEQYPSTVLSLIETRSSRKQAALKAKLNATITKAVKNRFHVLKSKSGPRSKTMQTATSAMSVLKKYKMLRRASKVLNVPRRSLTDRKNMTTRQDGFFSETKTSAVSFLKDEANPIPCKRSSTSVEAPSHRGQTEKITPSVRSIGVQTNPSRAFTRTVSTQLSMGTLKIQYVRSKGVQATPETLQKWLDRSSTAYEESTFAFGHRPWKRLRLDEEGEEEDEEEEVREVKVDEEDVVVVEEDMDFSDFPHDSTREPKPSRTASTAAVSDVAEVIFTVPQEPTVLENPKYIVFESSLKQIFDTCPVCARRCRVQRRRTGTFVSFSQKCPQCGYSRTWQSGPVYGSTPVGDLQLSAAVYFSGGSFTEVTRICKAMNIQIHQYNTFRRHSRCYLEPAVYHKWNEDQALHVEDLKTKGKIAVSGNMRAESPGQSGKYGTYTLMDAESGKVIDMALVQRKEVGGRNHMEKEGLSRCLDSLEATGLQVDCVVTDRRPQIQKMLRERDITQHYNVGHVVKALSKKLKKMSKDKQHEVIKTWLAAIKNHMYWTASSSTSGAEKVAKWTSIVNHIQDVHKHQDPLFPKCAHTDKDSGDPKRWFQPGTEALNTVEKLLMDKRVLKDVAKLSSCTHTPSLESFHSAILHFTSKTSDFTCVGRMCRLYLAGMHQNENAKRKRAVSKVSHPKHKKGQATTKIVKNKTTFGYVAALMRLVFNEILPDPASFAAQLKSISAPADLCPDFERTPDQEAIAAYVSRFLQKGNGPREAHYKNSHRNTQEQTTDDV